MHTYTQTNKKYTLYMHACMHACIIY